MKTSTPKSLKKEKLQEVDSDKFVRFFTVMLNLVILVIAIGIVYILLFPIEHKNNTELAQLAKESEMIKGLADIKVQLTELKKSSKEEEPKDANWQKMSKDYHLQLLINVIKNKIIAGDNFKAELEELNKFGVAQKDMNFQVLERYAAGEQIQVKKLIADLYNEATVDNKPVDNEGFIDSAKHFFTNLFTVKKLDEHKIHATSNEIASIIVQLLLDGRLEAAYTVASKFHGVHSSITSIADALKPANDALNAASKLEIYG